MHTRSIQHYYNIIGIKEKFLFLNILYIYFAIHFYFYLKQQAILRIQNYNV